MIDEQTVTTETDVESTTSTEESGAQDDLDQLLSEFDEETSSTEQSEQGSEQPTTSLSDEDKALLEEIRQEKVKTSIDKEVDEISKHLPEDITIPKRILRGAIELEAAENPKIAQAYANRNKNPEAWDKVRKSIANGLAKEYEGQPDKKSTQDREAVIAAVQSASTSSQDTPLPKFSEMNDQQFQKWKRENT